MLNSSILSAPELLYPGGGLVEVLEVGQVCSLAASSFSPPPCAEAPVIVDAGAVVANVSSVGPHFVVALNHVGAIYRSFQLYVFPFI